LGASGRDADAEAGAEATPPAMVEEEERARPENQEVGAAEVIVTAAAAVAAAAAARLTGSRRGHCGRGWGRLVGGSATTFWACWIELV